MAVAVGGAAGIRCFAGAQRAPGARPDPSDPWPCHRTTIGARAFIGSDTMLVAPVRVGARAVTGSGSVITEDIPDDAMAIGRARQVTKPGLAARIMQALRAGKGK